MKTRIALTEWLPDVDRIDHPSVYGLSQAVPTPTGYEPPLNSNNQLSSWSATSDQLAIGAESFIKSDGSKFIFVGLQDSIQRISATSTVDDVSATGGYNTAATRWEFVQWGDEVIATNYEDEMQVMGMSATAFSTLSASTSRPMARTVTSARNFVIVGNTFDTVDGTAPNRVRWSALGDATDWTVSAVTQSDYEDLTASGGRVQRVFGGEYLVVMQERSIWRADYVGSPAIWQFDEVVPQRGLVAPGAAVQVMDMIFFLASDGFYMLQNGTQLTPIGNGKVDKFFLNNWNGNLPNLISCAACPITKRIHWRYAATPGSFATAGITYDYGLAKWGSHAISQGDIVFAGRNDFYGDAISTASGISKFAAIYNNTTSASQIATLSTGRIKLDPDRNVMVTNVTVNGFSADGGAAQPTVTVRGYSTAGDPTPSKTVVSASGSRAKSTGRHNVRANGRFHEFTLNWAAVTSSIYDNPDAVAITVEYVPTSAR